MQASHLTPTTVSGFARSSLMTLLAFAFVCYAALAQVPSDELSEEDFTQIQQKATITTFGEKAVEIEFLSVDEQLRQGWAKMQGSSSRTKCVNFFFTR